MARPAPSPAPARLRPAKKRPAPTPARQLGRNGGRRYAVVYDTDGPRVRLGILWFLVAVVALVVGPLTAALCYGAAAAVAAAQVAKVWRQRRMPPAMPVAAGGAAAMGAGAVLGAGGLGLALAGTAVAACAVAATDGGSRASLFNEAGWSLQCAVPPGLVAGSMVLLVRLEVGAAVALLLLVSVYEIGDYLIGSGASNPYEGPVAGLAAVVVVTFIVAALAIPPFDFGTAWLFGLGVGVMAPLGQLAASALLPTAASPASGLRRLDSLLFAAPVWAWGVGLLIQNQP
jgi:hypothetical protein